ncbi:hypothetical protein V5799_025558 [Amblyomma americanum]|uniref:Ran gtpase-activating protein n=2 Tax=Amblyomma americanum TaxID=6943 RepID=A0AAQ4E8X6_AMBAM
MTSHALCTGPDALAPQVADVLRGNGRTLHSVKLIGNHLSRETASTLLLALVLCERLEELALQDSEESSACDAMAEALKSSRFLQKLSLVGLCLTDQSSFVSEALEQALGCATKVKINHSGLVGKDLCSVYASLALKNSLRSLHIHYAAIATGNDDTTQAAISSALCAALKGCKCLQSFHLHVLMAYNESEETDQLVAEIFDALICSPRLRKLTLVNSRLTLNTAQLLSVLVAQLKRSLVELRIESTSNISNAVLRVLEDMITRNVFLSRVTVRCFAWEDVAWACAAMDDAKEQNQGLLNKAAKFVMSIDERPTPCAKHPCASAFDELCGTASLLEHLVSLSGKSELQVSMSVKKARRYLDDNYMIYAGVVLARVLCEAGDGSMQFDELNVDCWRSIVQYLKLSDVVS